VRSERRWRGSGGGGRLEGGGPELVQDVEGAAGELAGDGQRGAGVAEPAGLECEVVGVVGAAWAARRQGGLIERPAQLRRALAGELAGAGAAVGAVHPDVDAGQTDRLA
jgi:hypothetical protein